MRRKAFIIALAMVFMLVFCSPGFAYFIDVNDSRYDRKVPQMDMIQTATALANSISQYQAANPVKTTLPVGTKSLKSRIYDLNTLILMHSNGAISNVDFRNQITGIKFSANSTLTANGNYFQTIANLLQGGYITDAQALNELQKLELIMLIEQLNYNR